MSVKCDKIYRILDTKSKDLSRLHKEGSSMYTHMPIHIHTIRSIKKSREKIKGDHPFLAGQVDEREAEISKSCFLGESQHFHITIYFLYSIEVMLSLLSLMSVPFVLVLYFFLLCCVSSF